MGLDVKKAPPLPAPTETDTSGAITDPVTDDSTITQRTSQTIPEDGRLVTVSPRRTKHDKDVEGLVRKGHQSHTSLLIEYFESSQADTQRPSVRVKFRQPMNELIHITGRPPHTHRTSLSSPDVKVKKSLDVIGDNKSVSSIASATEESNVSKLPVEVEVMPPRRHGSPLIPQNESSSKHLQPLGSDVSSLAHNAFLDDISPERKGSRSLGREEALAVGAVTGLAAGAVADTLKSSSRRRSRSRERIVAQKAAEKVKGGKSERRHRRSSESQASNSEAQREKGVKSPHRRSSRSHVEESVLSGAESSQVTTSRLSGDQRSFRSGTSKSSMNNPKLLDAVEDAIRRLILPELTALKQEQKANSNREKFDRDRRSSITSGSTGVSRDSREEISVRKISSRSSAPDVSTRSKGLDSLEESSSEKSRKERKRDREIERDSFGRDDSQETVIRDDERLRSKRSSDKKAGFATLATELGLGVLTANALHNQSKENINARDNQDERQERRKRRPKSRSRSDSRAENYEENQRQQEPPPMPLMSDINGSELTRASILSVETERPQSASAERMTAIREVNRNVASPSSTRSPLLPRESTPTQRTTPIQRSKTSQGELNREYLKDKERRAQEEYELDPYGRKVSMNPSPSSHQEETLKDEPLTLESNAVGAAAGVLLAGMHEHSGKQGQTYDYNEDYGHDPLFDRYVPYSEQNRGLSPIQSISGYTEDDGTGQQIRDSRLNRSNGSYSTMNRSPQHRKSAGSESSILSRQKSQLEDGAAHSEINQHDNYWDDQHLERKSNRELDAVSYRSSDPRIEYNRMTNYTDDSMDGTFHDPVSTGQNVRGLGANPDYVHTPIAVESAVASLVSASVITGNSESNPDRRASYASYDEGSERLFTNSPQKYAKARDLDYGGSDPDYAIQPKNSPGNYAEYELDDQGRKITLPKYPISKNATVSATPTGEDIKSSQPQYEESTIAPLQKPYKDRAMALEPESPRHSVDMPLGGEGEHEKATMGVSGIPDFNDPMPEIGYGYQASEADTSPSYIQSPAGNTPSGIKDHKAQRPDQPKLDTAAVARAQKEDSDLTEAEMGILGAVTGDRVAAALGNHNKETGGQDHDEQWQRTSDERKRDTLITNPYEGTSPVTLLGGQQDRNLLGEMGYGGINNQYGGFTTGSPVGLPKDEGYISSAPNVGSAGAMTPERMVKGVGFMDNVVLGATAEAMAGGDPFYTSEPTRHLSGMSHGTGSSLYDSLGAGIDRIQSKDIIALMEHLTARDAQRSARDTEILVTLVRAAAEMRNSFEDMKRLLADTEDVIISETQRNTDRSVLKAINGPRPLPTNRPSPARALQDSMADDNPAKKKSVFRRALKGLSIKSSNDLANVEQMLMQLLRQVEGLKVVQEGNRGHNSYDNIEHEETYEQDHGYEPEGNAGTSTASHPSQSGHFSVPLSRVASASRGFDSRKFSDNRISTVPEGDEEDPDSNNQTVVPKKFESNGQLLTPTRENVRGSSAPLGTPPQQHVAPASLSNENTPKTEKGKKYKSGSSFVAKISRWSETTTSTVARGFRSSGRRDTEQSDQPTSRSGSDLDHYESQNNNYIGDKLHFGHSHEDIPQATYENKQPQTTSPEDPKYKAHRNSLNLQHPQPRPGPTIRYQTALESQAQDFNSPLSPKSVDWGSSTSVNRLPANNNLNRYSNQTNGTGQLSPTSDGGYSQSSQHANGLQAAPARPPKEPLTSTASDRTRKHGNKLTKSSPLSYERLNAGNSERPFSDGVVTKPEYGSPRTLPANLGVPIRKPTGPRSMSHRSQNDNLNEVVSGGEQGISQRKRNTFGTIASNHSAESETF